MKSGQKFREKKTRRIVCFVEKYKQPDGQIVIRYAHPRHPRELGAMFKEAFNKIFCPVS